MTFGGLRTRAGTLAAGAAAVAVSTLRAAARDRVTTSAASLAFHGFLAIFPAIVALIGVAGLAGLSGAQLQSVVHAVGVLFPVQMSQALDEALRSPAAARAGLSELLFGVVVALWGAIEAMSALQVGLDVAYEVPADRGFVGRRVMAVPLLLATVAFGGAAFLLLVLGDPLRSLLPASFGPARHAFDGLWAAIRWGGSVALMTLLLSTFYAIGPRRPRPRLVLVSSGSVLAVVGWVAASAGFSAYLDHFGHESRTYGAFAGVAVLLLWLFLTSLAILLGAELNRELERRRALPGSAY